MKKEGEYDSSLMARAIVTDCVFSPENNEDNLYNRYCRLQTHELAYPAGHPQMAQIAIQQVRNLANNFVAAYSNCTRKPFVYKDKGSMAIIGRNRAVVDLPGNTHFQGITAFFVWLAVHLMSLVTTSNRVTTLYRWMIAYFSRDQSLRMIIRPTDDPENRPKQPGDEHDLAGG